MTWLPPELQFIWPDGQRKHRPKDGERFTYDGTTYTWDEVIGQWSDERGKIVRFDEKNSYALMYGCDGEQAKLPAYQEPKKKEQTEGDRLRDFFFPKNTQGCECGAWITGSPRHSRSCRLYREDQ